MFVSNWEDDDEGVEKKDLSNPKEQFLTAAEEGDLSKLQEIYIKNPEFLHVQDRDQYTALHRAAYNNHVEICKWLLSIGANPELRTETGWTPLHCASCWANFNVVDILLAHGVDVNASSNGQVTPLHLALNSAEDPKAVVETVKRLLNVPGINLKAVAGSGDTPLMIAKRTSKDLTNLITEALKKAET